MVALKHFSFAIEKQFSADKALNKIEEHEQYE
jgi:hypothetical protein